MSKKIIVISSDGDYDYVTAEYETMERAHPDGGTVASIRNVQFQLSSGEPLNLKSASRFEDSSDMTSYYVEEKDDIKWLLSL